MIRPRPLTTTDFQSEVDHGAKILKGETRLCVHRRWTCDICRWRNGEWDEDLLDRIGLGLSAHIIQPAPHPEPLERYVEEPAPAYWWNPTTSIWQGAIGGAALLAGSILLGWVF